MSRKLLNRSDWVVLGTILIGALVLYGLFHCLFSQSSSQVSVYYDDRLVATLDLNQDETLVLSKADYPLLLDDLEITVSNGKVAITKETSPNHICSRQAPTSSTLTPLVCLPNHVVVRVEGDSLQEEGLDSVIR